MRKSIGRFGIFFLAAVFALAAAACGDDPVGETAGNGSAESPYQVNDARTLKKVGTGADGWSLGMHYIQTADINLGNEAWTPIGTFLEGEEAHPFEGVFNGNGKTISNLSINAPDSDYQGLFGAIDKTAVVKNVALVDANIVGRNFVGGVAGDKNIGTAIQNCYVTGSVRGVENVGGIAGHNFSSEIRNCYTFCDVSGDDFVGGVAGANQGEGGIPGNIWNCYAAGGVDSQFDHLGGVAGDNTGGAIINCAALNPHVVSPARAAMGRVTGTPGGEISTLVNNYARNDMLLEDLDGDYEAPSPALDGAEGKSEPLASFADPAWWESAGTWSALGVGPWDFAGTWTWGAAGLPALRNVGGSQASVLLPRTEPGTL